MLCKAGLSMRSRRPLSDGRRIRSSNDERAETADARPQAMLLQLQRLHRSTIPCVVPPCCARSVVLAQTAFVSSDGRPLCDSRLQTGSRSQQEHGQMRKQGAEREAEQQRIATSASSSRCCCRCCCAVSTSHRLADRVCELFALFRHRGDGWLSGSRTSGSLRR